MKKMLKLVMGLLIVMFVSGCEDNSVIVEKEKYFVTYETDGGETVVAYQVEEGRSFTEPDAGDKLGYTFGGYYLDDSFNESYDFTRAVVEAFTLYTKWIPDEFSISFETNGGNIIDDISLDFGSDIVMPEDPEKEGYVFLGWFDEDLLVEVNSELIMGTEEPTYYAKWEPGIFTRTFETN